MKDKEIKKFTIMELIEGGTISGTNPLADGESHDDWYPATYNITVDDFLMDKYLVTKTLWDDVRNHPDTVARGYEMRAGGGKGVNHPVHTVSWFDAVKWLNARSELEGREPVYYLDAAYTQVFRSGSGGSWGKYWEVYVKASDDGYRLPTMDEWEYAARGGLEGKRFPWGDEIHHGRQDLPDRANYPANGSAYGFDTSPYTTWTFHPKGLESGSTPFTTPVDYCPPNDFGLHDMAGNLWEWNYDWHPSYVGSSRVVRGGCWLSFADRCRVAYLNYDYPDGAITYYGFRAVLPTQ